MSHTLMMLLTSTMYFLFCFVWKSILIYIENDNIGEIYAKHLNDMHRCIINIRLSLHLKFIA